jgi:hypothetical protein
MILRCRCADGARSPYVSYTPDAEGYEAMGDEIVV